MSRGGEPLVKRERLLSTLEAALRATRVFANVPRRTWSRGLGVVTLSDRSLHLRRGKTNFFEKRVGEYQKNGVMAGLNKDSTSHGFSIDNDF